MKWVACYAFLHALQAIECADNADSDWTDIIPKSNSKKKCTAGGAAGSPVCVESADSSVP